jgi:hypothetical protein
MTKFKLLMNRRLLVLLALVAAAIAAAGRGDTLAHIGMAYYLLCAISVFRNDQRSGYLLWAAVGVHLMLVGYSAWRWQTLAIIPCPYCMSAAGFALIAATAWSKIRIAFLPVLLMLGAWYAWPLAFAYSGPLPVNNQIGSQIQVQPAAATSPLTSIIRNIQLTKPHPDSDCGCGE